MLRFPFGSVAGGLIQQSRLVNRPESQGIKQEEAHEAPKSSWGSYAFLLLWSSVSGSNKFSLCSSSCHFSTLPPSWFGSFLSVLNLAQCCCASNDATEGHFMVWLAELVLIELFPTHFSSPFVILLLGVVTHSMVLQVPMHLKFDWHWAKCCFLLLRAALSAGHSLPRVPESTTAVALSFTESKWCIILTPQALLSIPNCSKLMGYSMVQLLSTFIKTSFSPIPALKVVLS